MAELAVVALSFVSATLLLVLERRSSRLAETRRFCGEALSAVIAWNEMPFRIARRSPEGRYEIAHGFHDLQERILWHQSWMTTESTELANAYRILIRGVKGKNAGMLRAAWLLPPVTDDAGMNLQGKLTPADIGDEITTFAAAVREYERLKTRPSRLWGLLA